jgi:ribosomal protein L7/L12
MVWIGLLTLVGIFGIILFLNYRIHVLEIQQTSLMQLFWRMTPDFPGDQDEIRQLLAQGSRLDAIRLVKQRYRCSLLEAKNMIEEIESARHLRP